MSDHDKHFNYDDGDDARRMIENDELGYEFTSVRGDSESAQLLRATIGHTPEAYKQHLEAPPLSQNSCRLDRI